MNPTPRSLAEWKELSASQPELAASTVIERVNAIAPETRRSIIAALPDQDVLAQHFHEAAQSNQPLAGAPYFLKDLYDIPGYPTTASSSFLPQARPNPTVESAFSKALKAQGAVFAGKTHLNEFAYGLSGENLTYGNCPHPIFPEKLSGGSSSGSAWAVRSGIVPIATGTDTGGSIRVPAAWCGIYGLRLSPNEWSTQGCFPLAPSFDTAGWFCSSAADMATCIHALLAPPPPSSKALRGVSLLDSIEGLSQEYRAKTLDTLERLNAQSHPDVTGAYRAATRSVAAHYGILQSIEAFAVHSAWLDTYREQYDPVVWQRIDRGRNWLPEQIEKAQTGEAAVKAFFEKCFQEYDFVAIPATQSPAISAAEHTDQFRSDLLSIAAPGSFARCPVLTIPIHMKDGTSQGIQILYKDSASALPLRILGALKESKEIPPPQQ